MSVIILREKGGAEKAPDYTVSSLECQANTGLIWQVLKRKTPVLDRGLCFQKGPVGWPMSRDSSSVTARDYASHWARVTKDRWSYQLDCSGCIVQVLLTSEQLIDMAYIRGFAFNSLASSDVRSDCRKLSSFTKGLNMCEGCRWPTINK